MARRREIVAASISALVANFLTEMEELDEDEEQLNQLDENIIIRRLWEEQQRNKMNGYSETIFVELYSDADFQNHFRLKRSSFTQLLQYLRGKTVKPSTPGNPQIPLEKQLQITLWIVGNQEVYRSVADRFGVPLSTAWQSVIRICQLLVDNRSDFIKWPTNEMAIDEIKKFQQLSGFPSIIGAIDCSCIPISTPSVNPELYKCGEKFHAINMQAVCTSNLKFTSVDVGSPGSMHDADVFRESDLVKEIRAHKDSMFPGNSHMVGDAAYPVSEVLMVPFASLGHLTKAQENFNKKLLSSRIPIDRAFALLRGRFRRLKYMYMHRTELIPLIILACYILHNICIEYGDICEDINSEEDDGTLNESQANEEDIFGDASKGRAKRNFIMSSLISSR